VKDEEFKENIIKIKSGEFTIVEEWESDTFAQTHSNILN
jgi:hypothetical protein